MSHDQGFASSGNLKKKKKWTIRDMGHQITEMRLLGLASMHPIRQLLI